MTKLGVPQNEMYPGGEKSEGFFPAWLFFSYPSSHWKVEWNGVKDEEKSSSDFLFYYMILAGTGQKVFVWHFNPSLCCCCLCCLKPSKRKSFFLFYCSLGWDFSLESLIWSMAFPGTVIGWNENGLNKKKWFDGRATAAKRLIGFFKALKFEAVSVMIFFLSVCFTDSVIFGFFSYSYNVVTLKPFFETWMNPATCCKNSNSKFLPHQQTGNIILQLQQYQPNQQ